jgi:hypothetical protein
MPKSGDMAEVFHVIVAVEYRSNDGQRIFLGGQNDGDGWRYGCARATTDQQLILLTSHGLSNRFAAFRAADAGRITRAANHLASPSASEVCT